MSTSASSKLNPQAARRTKPSKKKSTTSKLLLVLAVILALYRPLRTALSKLSSTPTAATLRNMSTSNGTSSQALKVVKRPWNKRGHADHGWLYTFHTFSFASYFDPQYESYGPLRVINEDRVQHGTGFGTHSHAEFLIWSYVVSGELEHKDSMGNLEKLRRGEVQFTSAGTGIQHSEYNRNTDEDVHFLQIWAKPHTRGLKPSYVTRKFADEMKTDRLLRIVEAVERHSGKDGESEPIPLHADLTMDASILSPGKSVEHELVANGPRKIYVHVTMSGKVQPPSGGAQLKVGDEVIGEGDGAFIDGATGPGTIRIESVGDKPAEFLLFDLGEADD